MNPVAPPADRGELLQPWWQPETPSQRRAIRRRIERLASILELAYGTPDLGNLPDPLDETVYIILTYQTDLSRARLVWSRLKIQFPDWPSVLDSPPAELEHVLQPSGFQRSRAALIRKLLSAVRRRWSTLSLARLESMSTAAAEAELRMLPGMDIKGARCVLLYSLRRAVFPVDSNVFRFMQRYGVLSPEARYRRVSTHNQLQALIGPSRRHSLHVNLVAHGQKICLPRNPKCDECPVRRTCLRG
jgi:endonuclease III